MNNLFFKLLERGHAGQAGASTGGSRTAPYAWGLAVALYYVLLFLLTYNVSRMLTWTMPSLFIAVGVTLLSSRLYISLYPMTWIYRGIRKVWR